MPKIMEYAVSVDAVLTVTVSVEGNVDDPEQEASCKAIDLLEQRMLPPEGTQIRITDITVTPVRSQPAH